MGLPQELVDYIVGLLRDDFRTLTACSLTCKSMFASTRPLIHVTLRLTERNNESILNSKKKWGFHWKSGHDEFRFLSHVAERGLHHYTQRLDIHDTIISCPDNLLPHLPNFHRVHTLVIRSYNAFKWASYYKTCFAHFHPTLTSLTLIGPSGPHRAIMQFALQFPNLENLCILAPQEGGELDPTTVDIDQFPPLSGHLRLDGILVTWWLGLAHLARALPNGFNFRTVELGVHSMYAVEKILRSCAHTLEGLTLVYYSYSAYILSLLSLALMQLADFRAQRTPRSD